MHQTTPFVVNTLEDVVIVMFQEPDNPPPPGFLNKLIHYLVVHAQPTPSLAHAELLLPTAALAPGGGRSPHYATYIGESAGWQSTGTFYSTRMSKFRAVPFIQPNVARATERACNQCTEAPYSIMRYLISGPLWFMARFCAETPHSPAHCGILVARILKMQTVGGACTALPSHPSVYGPSKLYRTLRSWMERTDVVQGSVDSDMASRVLHTIWTESDEAVARLTSDECAEALKVLIVATFVARGERRKAEIDLASALIRITYTRANAHKWSDGMVASTTVTSAVPVSTYDTAVSVGMEAILVDGASDTSVEDPVTDAQQRALLRH